jgi:pentose-5-phosphate-3-epimerase
VDGGVKAGNVRGVRDAGADLLVVGSGIFGAPDLTQAYKRLVQAVS